MVYTNPYNFLIVSSSFSHSTVVPYLEKEKMDALLGAPDRNTKQGCRDYALLLFLYNSGARASEAAQLTIADIDMAQLSVRLLGKGNNIRHHKAAYYVVHHIICGNTSHTDLCGGCRATGIPNPSGFQGILLSCSTNPPEP